MFTSNIIANKPNGSNALKMGSKRRKLSHSFETENENHIHNVINIHYQELKDKIDNEIRVITICKIETENQINKIKEEISLFRKLSTFEINNKKDEMLKEQSAILQAKNLNLLECEKKFNNLKEILNGICIAEKAFHDISDL